jgi:type IV pilus assembly protein PilA
MNPRLRGFTLIELMIVVAIIAILAAIALSQYQDYIIRSQVSEGASLAEGVKTAVAEFVNNYGSLPSTNASAGVASSTSITGTYVNRVRISGGLIYSHFGTGANAAIQGTNLRFSPITHAGSIQWSCLSGTLKSKWCPSSCDCSG